MKIKLLKALPWFGVGHIFETEPNGETKWYTTYSTALILGWWAEEVLEAPKTVWDLKIGDDFFFLDNYGARLTTMWYDSQLDKARRNCNNCFLTQEDAEFELLRRESRAKAWKPDMGRRYWTTGIIWWTKETTWQDDTIDGMYFHNGNVHKTKEESIEWGEKYGKAFWII